MKLAVALLSGAQAKLGSSLQQGDMDRPSCDTAQPSSMLDMSPPKTAKAWLDKVTTMMIRSPMMQKDVLFDPKTGKKTQEYLQYLDDLRPQFTDASKAVAGRATAGVLVWLEEVLNFTCPEEAERACAADHAFERFAKIAYKSAPELGIIRAQIPEAAMLETGRYGIDDPNDVLDAAEETQMGKNYPRLSYQRAGCNQDLKAHGRLYVTYDTVGEALTADDPESLEALTAFIHSRDRRGLCAGEDDPAVPINGCCAR